VTSTEVTDLAAEREARRAETNEELGMRLIEAIQDAAVKVLGKGLTIGYVEGFDPMSVSIDIKRANLVGTSPWFWHKALILHDSTPKM